MKNTNDTLEPTLKYRQCSDEKMLKFRFRPSFNFSIITEMQTESGNTVQDTEIMINLATKFYQDLFLVEDRHLESFTFVDQFDKR